VVISWHVIMRERLGRIMSAAGELAIHDVGDGKRWRTGGRRDVQRTKRLIDCDIQMPSNGAVGQENPLLSIRKRLSYNALE
jgi:hypothetical protein